MKNAGYKFAELARGESLQSPDTCDCCDRTGLKRTVKLINPAGRVVWFGTGCASRAMGCDEDTVRKARTSAIEREATNGRMEIERARQASEAEWQAFLNDRAGHGLDRFSQIEKLGGYKVARAAFETHKGWR